MSELDDFRRSLAADDVAWGEEWAAAADWAKVLREFTEELIRESGLPREDVEAAVMAEYRRIYEEWSKGEES